MEWIPIFFQKKVLGLFVNILTENDKYSYLKRKNFPQHIQMQLHKKQKTFFQILLFFWKLQFTLNILIKKDKPQSLSISENIDSKKCVYLND